MRQALLLLCALVLVACGFGATIPQPPAATTVIQGDIAAIDGLLTTLQADTTALVGVRDLKVREQVSLLVPNDVQTTAQWYQQTLPELGWKPEPSGTVLEPDQAVISARRQDDVLMVMILDGSRFEQQGAFVYALRAAP